MSKRITWRIRQIVLSDTIVVKDHLQPLVWHPKNLSSESHVGVVFGIGLPSIDDPRLDLQRIRGKPLDSQSIEEPGRIRWHVRRLVGPIVIVVIAEQANVGNKD